MTVTVIIVSTNDIKILLLQYYPVNINTNLDACNIHTLDFKCSFKIKLETEDGARNWVQDYNNGLWCFKTGKV